MLRELLSMPCRSNYTIIDPDNVKHNVVATSKASALRHVARKLRINEKRLRVKG